MILDAIDHKYLRSYIDRETGVIEIPISDLITRLFNHYGKVTAEDVEKSEEEVRKYPYHMSDPILDVFDAINDLADLGDTANIPYSEAQKLKFGMNIIKRTHDFEEAQKSWKAKPEVDKTWQNFQDHFEDEHDNLMEIRGDSMNDTAYHQAHAIAQTVVKESTDTILKDMKELETSVLDAIETEAAKIDEINLAASATSRTSSLSTSTGSNESVIFQTMMELKNEIKDLKAEVKANKNNSNYHRRNGRGDQNVDYSIPFWERPGSTHKYCWTHGVNKTHDGKECRNQKDGHKENATWGNWMGGNTNGIQKKWL